MANRKIICPNCKKSFELTAADYSDIVAQVRKNEFNNEVNNQIKIATEKLKAENQLATSNLKSDYEKKILLLKNELSTVSDKLNNKNEKDISNLKLEMKSVEDKYKSKIRDLEHELERVSDKLNLKAEKTISALQLELKSQEKSYQEQLRNKDELIDFYKDFKSKLSTKGLGESLEKYCFDEFNKIRSIAFPNATFKKDNEVIGGTKGDFIFREYDNDSEVELLSIMFEMKNEADDTATKQKNKDFFKKLDKDRKNKGCEYAILVSTLEADSDYYNTGIVDVSHKYEKMYVIRPQFFIPVIGFLRNAALQSLDVKRELARVQSENIDIMNFESKLNEFKEAFGRNYRLASEKFGNAVEQIDKAILQLNKIRDLLVGSDKQLALASAKADNITVAKLVKGNPTMQVRFNSINKKELK